MFNRKKQTGLLAINRYVLLLIFVFLPFQAYSDAIEDEIKLRIQQYANRELPIKLLVKKIEWSGISDARLFDLIEKDLLRHADVVDPAWQDDNSWRVKALAYSGNPKYLGTIRNLAESATTHPKLKRYAMESLPLLPKFEKWNALINAKINVDSAEKLAYERTKNMLTSGDYNLLKLGANSVQNNYLARQEMLDIVHERLVKEYEHVTAIYPEADAIAWLCKVLGRTKNPKYLPTLQIVKEKAKVRSIRKWADKAIKEISVMNP